MFVAIDQVFTLENILYLAKGALLSVAIAALSLLIGLVLGILGASGRRSKHKVPRAIAFVVCVCHNHSWNPIASTDFDYFLCYSIDLYGIYRQCIKNQSYRNWYDSFKY